VPVCRREEPGLSPKPGSVGKRTAGGDQADDDGQAYAVLGFCIALEGTYPARP
jgi:microcystin-dependent protein